MTMTNPASLIAEARNAALDEMNDLSRDLGARIPSLLMRLASALEAATQWRPIESAPKGDPVSGPRVLLKFKDDLSSYSVKEHERWQGLCFVATHSGYTYSGYDMGWRFAAPVGMGGFPDQWLAGWLPLPQPPEESE